MAINTNFNVNPYYDDFDEDKLFLRLLFKPGYAVQARELTQLQTLLQNQVGRFGNHVFKNGSLVTGGQTTIQNATYLNLSSAYAETTINVSSFEGKTIVDSVTNPTKRAEVLKVYDSNPTTSEPKTLIVQQIFGAPFTSTETIKTVEDNPVFANIAASGVGSSQVFSVNEGVFYYEGFFIKNLPQTVALAKYSASNANVKVGFEIVESIVNASQDTSLLDPAQNASNYQAPGADRFKITLTLATRDLASIDTTEFIELAQVQTGQLIREGKYPIYSVLEDTLARRTYDESGNYTVKPFKLSLETSAANSAQANVILSPGKAYIYGYEFETLSPTVITFDKPRTTESVVNKRITADYGAYVYANTIHGSPPIGGTDLVDLHCVSNSRIERATSTRIANTKIGTARIKTIAYDSSANTANANTFIYRSYLFDVNVNNVITGFVGSTLNVSTIRISNLLNNFYSNANNAYAGSRFRITSGPGSNEPAKTIISYDGAGQHVTLSEPFLTAPTVASTWAMDFDFNDTKSMVINAATPTNRPTFAIDLDQRSKDSGSQFGDMIIADSGLEALIFPLGEDYIANNSITDFVYSYKKIYSGSGTGQSFDVSGKTTLTVDTGEALSTASSIPAELSNYTVIVTDPTGTGYFVGQVLTPDLYSIAGNELTVTGAGSSFKANVIATIDVSTSSQRNKVLIPAAQNVATSTGTTISDVFGNGSVVLFSTIGQVHIAANTVVKTPGTPQQLFVSDVIRINSIFDFGNTNITTANLATATNVTNRYVLDTGQRDSFYDHASIKLKAGQNPATGNLLIRFDSYSSTGAGYFTVTSYPNYGDIPVYSSQFGTNYNLRDCLDFRPVRLAATTTIRANTDVFESAGKIPVVGSNIDLDYQYYLPRIDKIILNKDRSFEVLTGEPNLNPVEPPNKSGSMTLYILNEAPYLTTTDEITVQYVDHKRYTMRDIGAIDKRVENLEYYTSLTLLEQDTLNKQDLSIRDANGLQRFKNGILVDSFQSHAVADVVREDYRASIDLQDNEVRPSFNISNHLISFDSANSSSFTKGGPYVTLTSTPVSFIEQNKASRAINVNPFSVVNYLGKIDLDPKSDIWYDINKQADVLVNIGGDKDAWDQLLSGLSTATQIEWDSWENVWTGVNTVNNRATGNFVRGRGIEIFNVSTTTVQTGQIREGIVSTLGVETITQSIGDRVIDVSIIPYMRDRNVLFTGSSFKPDTTLYSFFDNENATKYVARANRFVLARDNLSYNTEIGNAETANIYNNLTTTVNGTCVVVKTSNNSVFVVSANPLTAFNMANANLVGISTGTTVRINGYEHFTGNSNAATASSITLRIDASGSNNEVLYANTSNSNTIYIVSGTGAGQERTMNAYNAVTRTANVSVNWTTIPDNTSVYTIGNPRTTASGDVAGIFFIPNSTYRVGEKRFRLIDNQAGDLGSSSTNGDTSFFSQGLLQTTEETILSATVPTITRASVVDERVVTTQTTTRTVTGYYDPVAQTFLISPVQYPQGVFINKIRVCFKTKDDVIPVTMQLRPSVNGFPSSSVIYPFGSVTLTPDKVNITDSPDFDTASKYTEFVFDTPVYMQPGEQSFVLLANSKKYEVFIAEMGGLDLTTSQQISEQPYGGSLFLSQNGSTWTPDQNADMMFRIYRCNFASTGTVYFNVNPPSSNTVYDLTHLIVSDLAVTNTTINYSFRSEKSGGGLTNYLPITPLTNYQMNDGDGRRVLNPSTGNNTFVLRATISTLNPEISPVIDTSRLGLLAVENIINDLPLTNDTIIIANTGANMQNGVYQLSLSGGNGSGATVLANVVGGQISRTWVTNGGSGYTTTPTVNLFASTATSAYGYVGAMCVGASSNGASIIVNGEDKKTGGNGVARYITRRVTLADSFESGDLRVYLTAYRPAGSGIYVYYKVLSGSDIDNFENKEYQLMTELDTQNFVSSNESDYREFTFAPGILNQANNSVSYTSGSTTYDKFKTFSIKIVMTGDDSTDVPKIRDFRAVALPRG